MKKLLVIALLISMGQLCAMEAEDFEKAWKAERASDGNRTQSRLMVEVKAATGANVRYWQDQLASLWLNCTNGELESFNSYFNDMNELECRAHFETSHPVDTVAFASSSSAASSSTSSSSASSSSSSSASPVGERRKKLPDTKRRGHQVRRHLDTHRAQYLIAVGGTGLVVGGALAARKHIKVRHAKGEKSIFDRMGRWIQQRYRGLVRSEKTTSEISA